MSTFSLTPLKALLPFPQDDTTHDTRLNQLLTQAEESLSAPNGMTRFIIGTSKITFTPTGDYTRLPVTITIDYIPLTTIDKVYVIRNGTETAIPFTSNNQIDEINITLTQALEEGERLIIEATGGFTEETAPPKLKFIAYQIAALRFFNPDPSNQNIPQEIHNQINAL